MVIVNLNTNLAKFKINNDKLNLIYSSNIDNKLINLVLE